MIEFIKQLFKHRHKWKIIRTIWPYPDGWGVYCPGCKMVIDVGLSKEDAIKNMEVMNER